MHLRRGHLRRLKDRVTWVRSSMINAESSQGVVIKDYAIPDESIGVHLSLTDGRAGVDTLRYRVTVGLLSGIAKRSSRYPRQALQSPSRTMRP